MKDNTIKVLIISDQNNKFELVLENENNNSLNLYANSIDSIFNQQYEKTSFTLNDIKINKYFESFDNINEVYDELSNKLKDSIIFENTNELIISIPLNSNKINEILFKLNEEIKTNEESISELIRVNKTLFKKINLLESKIEYINKELNECKNKYKQLELKNNENINKELNECKNKNKELELKNNEIIYNLNILNNYKKEKEKKHIFKSLIYTEDLKKSTIIKENEINMINNWIYPNFYINYELLYKATIDGDTFSKFHEKCDNKENTICFINLENNIRIGGYTSKSWNHIKKNDFINDDNTFIFDLYDKKKYLPTNNKCIYCSKKGFSFGNFNIGIKENNFLKKKLIASFDNNYYNVFKGFRSFNNNFNKSMKKFMLVGDSCVGKTNIFNNFIGIKTGKVCGDVSFSSTIGMEHCQKIFTLYDGRKIKLDLCDIGGKERYQSLVSSTFKDLNAIIMCYDITKKETFESLKNVWYELIKQNAKENIILGIIGNKNDLLDFKEVNDEEAKKFAKEINASFSLV